MKIKKTKKTKKIKAKKENQAMFKDLQKVKIKVIGIGGGGGAIVSEIASLIKSPISFIAANTDVQAFKGLSKGVKSFQFGEELTQGLGTGMNPERGELAAQNEVERIKKMLGEQDLCILIASLGGGTGSGAGPIFAKLAKELNQITFGIFTMPFKFEGEKRAQIARKSLEKMKTHLNALTIVPNQRIFQLVDEKTSLKESLSCINKILAEDLEGLIEFIYSPGLINIDWADLRTVLDGRGKSACLNTVVAQGPTRSEKIIQEVLKNSLNEYNIQGAEKVLFNIFTDKNLKMTEVEAICKHISDFNSKAKIIFGISQSKKYHDKIKVTLLATGWSEPSVVAKKKRATPKKKKKPQEEISSKPVQKDAETQPHLEPEKGKVEEKKVEEKKVEKKKKAKRKVKKAVKKKAEEKKEEVRPAIRRSALQVRQAVEKEEAEQLVQEQKWDIPAFLRRRADNK